MEITPLTEQQISDGIKTIKRHDKADGSNSEGACSRSHLSRGSDLVSGTVKVCQKAGVAKVIAADHHGMKFLLSDCDSQRGGIVFRDDSMTLPELGWLRQQVNDALSQNTEVAGCEPVTPTKHNRANSHSAH